MHLQGERNMTSLKPYSAPKAPQFIFSGLQKLGKQLLKVFAFAGILAPRC